MIDFKHFINRICRKHSHCTFLYFHGDLSPLLAADCVFVSAIRFSRMGSGRRAEERAVFYGWNDIISI
jgi:hypothetical protein